MPPPPSRWRRAQTCSVYIACGGREGGGGGPGCSVNVEFTLESSSLSFLTPTDFVSERLYSQFSVPLERLKLEKQATRASLPTRSHLLRSTTKPDPRVRGAAAVRAKLPYDNWEKFVYLKPALHRGASDFKWRRHSVFSLHIVGRSVAGRFNYSNTCMRVLLLGHPIVEDIRRVEEETIRPPSVVLIIDRTSSMVAISRPVCSMFP